MGELVSVEVKKTLGSITDNLDAVRESILAKVEEYKGMVVTEDNIPYSKKVLAEIRKEQKALDDDRKKIKKEWEAPFKEFEERAKSIISLYDEPIKAINEQLTAYDEARKDEKRNVITGIYDELKGDLGEWLPLENIFKSEWLNVSCSEKKIREDIESDFRSMQMSIDTLKSMESEFEEEGLAVLKKTLSLQDAVQEINCRTKMKAEIIRKEQQKAYEFAQEQEAKKAEEVAQEQELKKAVFSVEREEPVPDIPPMEGVKVVISIDESELDSLKELLDFNQYRYEVMM